MQVFIKRGVVVTMSYDPNNIFARILRKEISCKAVYEDEYVLAFHDIRPKAPIHILLIPKGEFKDFHDFVTQAKPNEVSHFYRIAGQLCQQHGLLQSGFRVVANSGPSSGQEVDHFHIHLLGGASKLGPMC
jgi:diadenosine tetraphosphate (Ap4A) HIT family hydrolase